MCSYLWFHPPSILDLGDYCEIAELGEFGIGVVDAMKLALLIVPSFRGTAASRGGMIT